MSFYYEWVDIVTYPNNPNRVKTREDRLDCSEAIRVTKEPLNSDEEIKRQRELIKKFGTVLIKDQIVYDNDNFEVIEITDYGRVVIWTEKRVWTLLRQGDLERLFFLPRHPQFSGE